MKELAIGETGLVDGKPVKCIEWDTLEGGCNGCAFYNDFVECGTARPCTASERKDKKSVMFVTADSCTGTPEENHHQYCPYCGKMLEAKEYEG